MEEEPSEQPVNRQLEPRRNRSPDRTPEIHSRTDNPPIQSEYNNFRPPTVCFGTQEEIILPPPRDESRKRTPLRAEQHKREPHRTKTSTEDEGRMSSRPSRNNLSRYGLRENPTPKTYPNFLPTQSLPTPTNLKDDLLVGLALMREFGIITTLPHSKYSSPIFAQRKPNGNLRNLVDLRRINHPIKNDYGEHNHPVTTIADAA